MNTLIGNTPIVEIDGILIKCEFMNPTGSSKDRIAYEMLTNPLQTAVVEASSGNTGISIAFVSSIYGIKCRILVPRTTSMAKIEAMLQYGATIDTGYTNLKEATRAASLFSHQTSIKYTNQFDNKCNERAQIAMAYEIKNAGIYPECIVCGVGTGGTLAGLYKVFPKAVFITPLADGFNIEGISDGVPLPLKPKQCRLISFDVGQEDLNATKKYLAQHAGLWVGDSTVANFIVAKHFKKDFKSILIIGHDNGWRYL